VSGSFRRAAAALLAALVAASCAPPPPPAPPPAPTPVPTAAPTREEPPKVGLALGGGGARGFAEVGVLRVLEQEKIPISFVAGSSVGSLVGALYADTGRVLDAEFHAVAVTEEDLFDYRALAVFSGGFVKGERLRQFLGANLKSRTIEQMRIPYAAVAVDVATGRAVAFQRGPVAPAVHASCAIPGVFVPVSIGERTYVDGGVVNPVPADVARSMGADVVIAVSIPPLTRRSVPTNPIAVAYQAVTIMSAEIARLRAREADVVISPDVGDVAYDDFTQKKRLIAAGEEAARKALPEIRALLAARTRRVPLS
jgi:NTE family protein